MARFHKELSQGIEGHRRPSPAGTCHIVFEVVQIIGTGIIKKRASVVKNRRRPDPCSRIIIDEIAVIPVVAVLVADKGVKDHEIGVSFSAIELGHTLMSG